MVPICAAPFDTIPTNNYTLATFHIKFDVDRREEGSHALKFPVANQIHMVLKWRLEFGNCLSDFWDHSLIDLRIMARTGAHE